MLQYALTMTSVAVCILLGPGCRRTNRFVAPPPPKVTVARPLQQEVITFTEMPGRTEAVQSVEIRARVQGFLQAVEFEEGGWVEKGDLLYQIEPDQYAAAVEAASATLAGRQAELDRSQAQSDRMDRLREREVAAEMEAVDAKAALDLARANVQGARAALTRAELDLSYTKITAPLAGRVNRTTLNVGNLVGQLGSKVLTTIVPWNPIYVFVTVDERTILKIRRRAATTQDNLSDVKVRLKLTDGSDYGLEGRLDYFDNQVDAQTGTAQVRAVFDNPDDILVPGTFVRARFPSVPYLATLLPDDVVQRDLSGHFLLTVDSTGQVERLAVERGDAIQGYRVITSEMPGDTRVIINGIQRVRPGMMVEVQEEQLTTLDFGAGTPQASDSNAPPSEAS